MFRSYRRRFHCLDNTRVREEDINGSFFLRDLFVEPIEIFQFGHVAPHGYDIISDFLYGFIQLSLPASSNKYESPFGDESLRDRESDPAVASSDNCDFPLQCWLILSSFL